jgi:hypothetical protein
MSDSSSDRRPASARTGPKKRAKREDARATSEGVLANLPRTRPQRSSPRRDAARATIAKATAASAPPTATRAAAKQPGASAKKPGTGKRPAKPQGAAKPQGTVKPRGTAKPQRTAKPQGATEPRKAAKPQGTIKPLQEPAPRQGFETESDSVHGPVQPPGGVDLFASAAELAGELTKSGISTGGRLLKDFLTRLPLN